MLRTEDLALTVERQVPGELVTNALKIKAFVEERIKDYTVEKYYDDPDAAKKDRAVLNAAAKDLNGRRLSLERDFMAPFDEFKAIIKQTTSVLDFAAAKLDEVVKAVEETHKNEKRREIEEYFTKSEYTIVTLEKIFDQKWLNKTVKFVSVAKEIDERIKKIFTDLELIDRIGQDAETVKALYLNSLDIGSALAEGDRLKANRERVAKEAAEREARKHDEHIEAQAAELRVDTIAEIKAEAVTSIAAAALEIDPDPIVEFTIRFRGTRSALIAMRKYITDLGIEYEKLGEA
jgi:hypothetical protein